MDSLIEDPSHGMNQTIGVVDNDRWLATRARELGLSSSLLQSSSSSSQRQRRPVQQAEYIMHSVGVLGSNEHLDPRTGNVLLLRRHQASSVQSVGRQQGLYKNRPPAVTAATPDTITTNYGALGDLFQPVEDPVPSDKVKGDNREEDETEVIVQGGSLQAAVFGIIKGTVGPAILYLARGFRNAGWGVAIASMMLATYMFISNAYLLLECWKVESAKQREMADHIDQALQNILQKGPPTSPQTSPSAATITTPLPTYTPVLLTYGELARRALGRWSSFVNGGIALFQFGVVLTYLIFVPDNIQECVSSWTGVVYPKTYFVMLMVLIEIPLSWITDIRQLTPANVTATLLIAFGLCSVLAMAFAAGWEMEEGGEERTFVKNLEDFPVASNMWFIFVGTSFFMMEGSMTLVVPLQEAVYLPQDKERFPHVNAAVTFWIVVFYIVFSLICGAAFGDDVRTAMTASLDGSLATAVQLAYSVAVLLTFPLQNFPALQVTCTAVLGKRHSSDGWERNLLVTGIIIVLGLVAVWAIDYLGNVVSLLGSLFGIPLALIFPPIMHTRLVVEAPGSQPYCDNEELRNKQRWKNYCVVGMGVLATIAASYATIEHWHANAEHE